MVLQGALQNYCVQLLEKKIIAPVEPIDIVRGDGASESQVLAQVALLSDVSWIDKSYAKQLGLYSSDLVVERVEQEVHGRSRLVDVIEVAFTMKNVPLTSRWCVTDRSEEKTLVLLGKNDLSGFLIQV
jgi:hypothetical protein